jgi:hypothetical protein
MIVAAKLAKKPAGVGSARDQNFSFLSQSRTNPLMDTLALQAFGRRIKVNQLVPLFDWSRWDERV